MNHTRNYLLVCRNFSKENKERKKYLGDDLDGTEVEQREKLRGIANKIDTDQNGKISRDEMNVYVQQRVKFVLFLYIQLR
jgi:hypothetical protein